MTVRGLERKRPRLLDNSEPDEKHPRRLRSSLVIARQLRPRSLLIFVVNSSTLSFLITNVGTKICLVAGIPDLSPPSIFAIIFID
jgi:hypothetical protein